MSLRSCLLLTLLLAGLPLSGCGNGAKSPADDLSIPKLAPKALVWVEDWKGEPEVTPARAEATDLMHHGDALKSQGDYAAAEKTYQQAMEADPTWDYPSYQMACNCELSGRSDRSKAFLDQAIERGLDDFPTVLADDELGALRKRSDFPQTLKLVRERYMASSATKVGQPIAVRPTGEKPKLGWPVMVLLHGYGDTNLSYLDHAQMWADAGFVAIAVPGSVPTSRGRFMWDLESADPTQQDVQAILKSPLLTGVINPMKVFLQGFSQGALHAMTLTIEHPEQYAGVLSVAPGGSFADKIVDPKLPTNSPWPVRVVFIHGEREPHAAMVENWRRACEQANWKFRSRTHPGGHHYPQNWADMHFDFAAFLLSTN